MGVHCMVRRWPQQREKLHTPGTRSGLTALSSAPLSPPVCSGSGTLDQTPAPPWLAMESTLMMQPSLLVRRVVTFMQTSLVLSPAVQPSHGVVSHILSTNRLHQQIRFINQNHFFRFILTIQKPGCSGRCSVLSCAEQRTTSMLPFTCRVMDASAWRNCQVL